LAILSFFIESKNVVNREEVLTVDGVYKILFFLFFIIFIIIFFITIFIIIFIIIFITIFIIIFIILKKISIFKY